MPYYEREKELLDLIMRQERVSIKDLQQREYVSKSTLRRDLIRLEEKGLIVRTHGGVIPVIKAVDTLLPFYLREDEQKNEKQNIAGRAARLVHDGDIIMLDSSTSAYKIVPYLTQFKNLVVISSGARTACLLGELGIKNICSGGEMITNSFSLVGESAIRTVSSYNADIVFFSCRGLSEDGFLSDSSTEENAVRRAMIEHAKRRVLLCSSDKIGQKYLQNICRVSEIDNIICDKELPAEIVAKLRKTKNNEKAL